MPGLVIELQADALNRDIRVSDLLRKALVVSRKLEIAAIEEWLVHELNGYPRGSEIPDYREIQGQIKVWNPYHGWQPLNFADPKEAELLSKRKIMQPVGELDSLLEKDEDSGLQVPFSQDIVNNLMRGMDVPLQPALHVPKSEVVGILDAVRNSVLDWSLTLEKKGIIGEGMTFSKEEKRVASQVTYQVTTNIGTMQNSQLQQVSPGATQSMHVTNDIKAILAFLSSLKRAMNEIELRKDEKKELAAEIATIEDQAESPKPKPVIITESLKSIRTILEGAAGSMVAAGLLSQLAQFL